MVGDRCHAALHEDLVRSTTAIAIGGRPRGWDERMLVCLPALLAHHDRRHRPRREVSRLALQRNATTLAVDVQLSARAGIGLESERHTEWSRVVHCNLLG
jgi:hypothetical protein